jgi:hypothetical protein
MVEHGTRRTDPATNSPPAVRDIDRNVAVGGRSEPVAGASRSDRRWPALTLVGAGGGRLGPALAGARRQKDSGRHRTAMNRWNVFIRLVK